MTDHHAPAGGEAPEMPGGSVLGVPREAGLIGRIVERFGFIFAAGIVCAAVMLLMEVFLRYVLNRPTIWAHETSTFFCALAFLYGGLYCASRDSHIRVVLLYDALSSSVRRALDIFSAVSNAVASAFFAWAAWLMVGKAIWMPSGEVRLERSGSAWNPAIPAWTKIFLLVVLIIMTLQFAVFAWNHLRRASHPSLEGGKA